MVDLRGHAQTLLRWHRRMVRRRWTYPTLPRGRPPVPQQVQTLSCGWPARTRGGATSASAGSCCGLAAGSPQAPSPGPARQRLQPAPRRAAASPTWRSFLRQQAAGILACDFPDRGHRVPAAAVRAVLHSAADPARTAGWRHRPPTGAGSRSKPATSSPPRRRRHGRPIPDRDRDSKLTQAFDDIWRAVGAEVIGTPIQAPNANAVAQRWVGTVRWEALTIS